MSEVEKKYLKVNELSAKIMSIKNEVSNLRNDVEKDRSFHQDFNVRSSLEEAEYQLNQTVRLLLTMESELFDTLKSKKGA